MGTTGNTIMSEQVPAVVNQDELIEKFTEECLLTESTDI